MAAIIASVAPQVTVTWVSGSIAPQPGKWRAVVAAIASRSGLLPQVIAYWLMSSRTAAAAASLSSGGHGKSGKPWARLTAPAADREPVHLADDRFAEAFGLGRDPGTCHGPQSSPRAGRRSGQTRRRSIGLAPGAPEERLAVDVDLEVDGQVERLGIAGLDRACPDLGLEGVLAPSVDDVGVEDRARGIGIGRGHRQRLGRVEPATVLEEVLAAVVDRDRHGPGDDVVRDPPDRLVGAASAVECRGVGRRGLERRHRRRRPGRRRAG